MVALSYALMESPMCNCGAGALVVAVEIERSNEVGVTKCLPAHSKNHRSPRGRASLAPR